MGKLTLEEKRLQQIRMQLFGKEQVVPSKNKNQSSKQSSIKEVTPLPVIPSTSHSTNNLGEARFLRQDITKVVILSSIAVGGQFLLHYLSLQGIINLNVLHLF